MSEYLGDFLKNAIVYGEFNTRAADGTPTTLAGTPVLRAYRDDNTAETTAGITLSVDFDNVTGLNVFKVDTSNAAYSTGTDWRIVIQAGTVGGVSVVGAIVGHFSIENRLARVDWAQTQNATAAINLTNTRVGATNVIPGTATPFLSTVQGQSPAPTAIGSNAQGPAIDFTNSPTTTCYATQAIGDLEETGTLDGHIEESANGSTGWTAISGATFTQVTTANNIQTITFTRTQPYLRWAATVTGASVLFTVAGEIGDIPALSMLEDVNDVLTSPMTESYAADGAAPTFTQFQYMIWSFLSERNVSGVTVTAKKLDGSTTSMTFTLNSATQPTGQTRSS